jgi:O-antigen/teichoic acid export membrane protein
MSRSKRFVAGLLPSYGYQAMLVLAGIWLTPLYLRYIGQHNYGLWLLGTQLLTYLTLTDFGVVALLPLETAYATGRAGGAYNMEDVSQVIGRTLRLVLYQMPIVVAVAVGIWFTLPKDWQNLRGPLGIVLCGFVVGFPLRVLPAILSGLQDLAFDSWMLMLGWGLSTIATISMVLAGWNLYALAIGWLVYSFAMSPFYIYRIVKRYPGLVPRHLPSLEWSWTRTQLGKSFWISVAQVAQLLMSNTDLLIIGRVLGPSAVVPYACTGKLASVLANQAQILMQTATPGLCELKTGGTRERLFQVLVALTNGILSFSGLVFCIVLLVNRWFVTWWVTGKQYGGMLLTVVILLNILMRHWASTSGYSVFCLGYQRRISLTNLSDGLVTASACLGLILLLGPVGAPAGSIVGACLVSLPWNLWIVARDTGVSVRRLVTAMLGGWFWRFVLVATGVAWIAARWSPSNLLEAAAAAICITAVYGLIMVPNMLRSPLGVYIRPLLSTLRNKSAPIPVQSSS